MEEIIFKTMEEVMHESMIPYSEYVILDRALPRVEDGLKPVQRRILFDMNELGMTPDKPYKKCARIVGDCLGKYHPHGDSSVYQALVRLAQPFNMSGTLVDGQGNFGDIDGNGAAAMRYTECRLTPLAMELLKGMGTPEDDIVKWNCNFDDTLKEPDILPGRFPNLLVNGAYGIAIGFATNIPTHNLGETIDAAIAYIDNPKIKLPELMKHLPGPDFPTGGLIIAGDELVRAYETGKGKILIRARIHYENDGPEKKLIVIDELPYQVNRSSLLESIIKVREEKKGTLLGISDVLDESDRNGMRIVIKVKKDFDPRAITDLLFKYTNLQVSFAINMVAIAEGKPLTLSLLKIYDYYVNYQRDFIVRRTRCELDKAKKREHILTGLVIAVKNIDEVVKIIKNSQSTSEAREGLKTRFKLTDRQADAILDLRLARLTHLEVYKLEEELKALRELIVKLTAILGSKKMQMDVVKKELLEIKKTYKTPRRSEILYSVENYTVTDGVEVEKIPDSVIMLSARGSLKRMSEKAFDKANRAMTDSSSTLDFHPLVCRAKAGEQVYLFTNLGNCYRVDVESVPEAKWRERGAAVREVVKEISKQETVVFLHAFGEQVDEQQKLVFFTENGMVKISAAKEYLVAKSCFQAIKLKDGDTLIKAEFLRSDVTMLFITQKGMSLNAEMTDVPVHGRISGGVKGINLNDGDKCIFAGQVEDFGEQILITDKGFAKRIIIGDLDVMARARKGLKVFDLKGATGSAIAFSSFVTQPYDLLIETQEDPVRCNSEDIVIVSRQNAGKAIKKGIGVRGVYAYNTEINS